jgi:hypothetical protein
VVSALERNGSGEELAAIGGLARPEQAKSFDGVAELPKVARPIAGAERSEGLASEARRGHAVLGRELAQSSPMSGAVHESSLPARVKRLAEAQQPGVHGQGQLCHVVQEERASGGRLELAGASRVEPVNAPRS